MTRAIAGARAAAWALVALLALSGCAGSLEPEATGSTDSAETTEPGGGGEVTLSYLFPQPEDPSELDLVEADVEQFSQSQSGISVEVNVTDNDNLRTILQTQLLSGEGPDVFEYDTGPGFAGVLAERGLLYDLTDAYEERSWTIYDWAKDRVTFSGQVVGVPNQVEEIGIFYNADLFQEYGLTPPHNLDDLRIIASTLRDNGVIPFAFGNQEGWEAGHLLSMTVSSMLGEAGTAELIAAKRSWDSPEVIAAIDVFFREFAEEGFLPESPNAITYDNANALFYSQEAAMNPTGTWLILDIEESATFDVGFFPFPAEDGPGIFSGGLGSGTFVGAQTSEPEAALTFLDYLQTENHGLWQVENLRTIPAFPVDTSAVDASPLFAQVLDSTSSIDAGASEFGYNIDVLMTDVFNQTMWDGLQAVLSSQTDPASLASQLAEAYDSSASDE